MRKARLSTQWLVGAFLVMGGSIAAGAVATAETNDNPNGTVRDHVAEIVAEADAGRDAGAYITTTADLGIEAAIECARRLDAAHPFRNAALLEVISLAGQSRRSNIELLKLYDPPAYRLYYTPDGVIDQQRIAGALRLEKWPTKLPEAMVRAAPVPTMQWMREQAKVDRPEVSQLISIWQTWGFWARVGHERQYRSELGDVVVQLATNRAILTNDEAAAALVRFAGEVEAPSATEFIVKVLEHGAAPARAEAAVACGRAASDAMKVAIIGAARREIDGKVQEKLAIAAEAWPDQQDVGAAMLELFRRALAPVVRREILFTASHANWNTRSELMLRAFDMPGDGVLGAALVAMSVRPEARATDRMLELAKQTNDAEPPLIDALGETRDTQAVPHLLRWLAKEESPVVRVKLLLALEKTTRHEADAMLLSLLNSDSSAMVVEQTMGVIARRKMVGGESTLIAMALDGTAPMQLRIQAIWAMGHFDTPEVRATLEKLDREPARYFKATVDEKGKPADTEAIDMARLIVALGRILLNDPAGDAGLQGAYDRGTAVARMTALVMLAQTGHDHPIIRQGLASTDTAIIFGATRAAAAADPRKYHDELVALRHAPFVEALLSSGLDSANLRPTLDAAIAAGEKR